MVFLKVEQAPREGVDGERKMLPEDSWPLDMVQNCMYLCFSQSRVKAVTQRGITWCLVSLYIPVGCKWLRIHGLQFQSHSTESRDNVKVINTPEVLSVLDNTVVYVCEAGLGREEEKSEKKKS